MAASACAPAAAPNTELFQYAGLGYVHSLDFAEFVFEAARSRPDWLANAYGWGAHLAADQLADKKFLPKAETLHCLVEVAADTLVFYGGSPLGTEPLGLCQEQYRKSCWRGAFGIPLTPGMRLANLKMALRDFG